MYYVATSYIRVYSARICHARACGFKHARACGLALVLTPTKGREPLPGMEYSAYTECDTLLSLSIMHSCCYYWLDTATSKNVQHDYGRNIAESAFYVDARDHVLPPLRYTDVRPQTFPFHVRRLDYSALSE